MYGLLGSLILHSLDCTLFRHLPLIAEGLPEWLSVLLVVLMDYFVLIRCLIASSVTSTAFRWKSTPKSKSSTGDGIDLCALVGCPQYIVFMALSLLLFLYVGPGFVLNEILTLLSD